MSCKLCHWISQMQKQPTPTGITPSLWVGCQSFTLPSSMKHDSDEGRDGVCLPWQLEGDWDYDDLALPCCPSCVESCQASMLVMNVECDEVCKYAET